MFKTYDFEKNVKEVTLKWELDDEDKIMIYSKLKWNKTFHRVFNPKYNLTKTFEEYVTKYGKARTDHIIITIKGRTGSGKSSVGSVITWWIHGTDLSVDSICFNHQDQKKLLKVMGKNSTIMRDEQTIRFGIGSKNEMVEIQNWDETLRKDGINFIYVAPTERFHGTAHKNLEFIARNKQKRISMFALYRGDERRKVYTGYCLFKIPTIKQWPHNYWTKYQRKKDRFNLKTRTDSHGYNWKEYVLEIKEHPDWRKDMGYNTMRFIINDLYMNQPTAFRQMMEHVYLSKVGLKKKAKIPKKPDCCPDCDSINVKYYYNETVWKCMKCGSSIG